MEQEKQTLLRVVRLTLNLVFLALFVVLLGGFGYWALETGQAARWEAARQPQPEPTPEVVEGVDVESGLIAEGEYMLVKMTCTACHSGKLVTQNRATEQGWTQMIRWMQETQGLWDLGPNETPIVTYLATYYAPEAQGRRAPLSVSEWYELD